MGARASHEARYPSGHDSISDDGSGNVVIADGKQILVPATGGTPSIACKDLNTCGINFGTTRLGFYVVGEEFNVQNNLTISQSEHRVIGISRRYGDQILVPSADFSITGIGDIIPSVSAITKITSDGVYTLTNPIGAGADGQELRIENVSANTVTLQEGYAVAQGSPITVRYSTDAVAWEQV